MDLIKRTILILILKSFTTHSGLSISSASISAAVLVLLLEIVTSKCWRQKGNNPDVNPLYINGPSGQIDLTKAIFVSNHSVMAVNFLDKLEKALMQYNTNLSTSDPDVIKAICSAGILNQSNAQRLLNSAERDTRQNNFKGKKC